jgi:uncharacterized protein YgiM (DUF1202 family)
MWWNTRRIGSFPPHPTLMRRRESLLALLLVALIPVLAPGSLEGQATGSAVVETEANFRAVPNGEVVGRLAPGTRVTLVQEQDQWSQVTLEGYVWERSMQILQEDGFDLVISESGGENLREEPAGRIAGQLVRGTLLEELGRTPGWVRVRRTAWIWGASLAVEDASALPDPPADSPEPEDPDPEEAPPADAPPVEPAPTEPAPTEAPPAPAEAPPAQEEGWLRTPGGGIDLRAGPEREAVGRAEAGTDLRVLAREDGWARVQLEGWVRLDGDEASADAPPSGGLVTVADLRNDPARFEGREVELELQFISLERAEAIRTGFEEGEPFLLTRGDGGQRSFVYVAVSSGWLEQVEGLAPLDRLRIRGRVRVGAARFTGNPILELLDLERLR